MDPRPKVIVAAPSSSIFSHQSQATKSIDESLPHATVETYLEAADDEAESLLANLRGLPQQLGWSEVASTALMCSESDSYTEALPLPWHEGEQLEVHGIQQSIQQPTTIETSKWTKLVMGKICKAFGVNTVGFEHEIFDLITRMDQKRQVQLQNRGSPSSASRKGKGRKKGGTEV